MTQAAPHPTPARSDRGARTRLRILDAAGHCFASAGFSKTTVEEVAAQAGVSKGIVYHHFRGKEGVLEALIERIAADWQEVSGLERWAPRSKNLEEALGGMIRGSLDYARSNPLVRGLFQADPIVVMGLGSSEGVRRLSEESRKRMVAAIEGAVASGELRSDLDAERMASVVRMLNMALIEHLLDPNWIDVSDERFVDTCLEVLFRGIKADPR